MRRTSTAILLVFLCATVGSAAEAPSPPAGCRWQPIPELKAHLAVPTDWRLETRQLGDALGYEITPPGTGSEPPPRSIYTMVVERHLDPESVIEKARRFVDVARENGVPTGEVALEEFGGMTRFTSVVLMLDSAQEKHEWTFVVDAFANPRTGTLYTIRLEIPVDELPTVAPLATECFNVLRLDNDI